MPDTIVMHMLCGAANQPTGYRIEINNEVATEIHANAHTCLYNEALMSHLLPHPFAGRANPASTEYRHYLSPMVGHAIWNALGMEGTRHLPHQREGHPTNAFLRAVEHELLTVLDDNLFKVLTTANAPPVHAPPPSPAALNGHGIMPGALPGAVS